ncbi:MAG: hypothetical protein KBD24_01425 [Candidatus Pacebacteria bacterium]|nr:hypothetical protein [Candidatus Paceibacterota bacterium]
MLPLVLFVGGILDVGMFLLMVCMHATRKTTLLLTLYIVQSVLVASFFVVTAVEQGSAYLYVVAGVTLFTKAVLVPILYRRVMRRMGARFSSDTYLDTPWTLVVLCAIAVLSFSVFAGSISDVRFATVSPILAYAPLHLAGILATLFLAVNRKEAFSQIIALLALENWIVFVASLAGFHQTLAIELAVTLEMIVLVVISALFIAMVHDRFGSLDISKLTHLSERDEPHTP